MEVLKLYADWYENLRKTLNHQYGCVKTVLNSILIGVSLQ